MNDSEKAYAERREEYRTALQMILNAVMNETIDLLVPQPEKSLQNAEKFHVHLTPELIFQVGGETEIRFPESAYILRPGRLCIVPRHTPHTERIVKAKSFAKLVGMIRPDGFSLHISKPSSYKNPERYFIVDRYYRSKGSQMARYMDEVIEAYHSSSAQKNIIIRGLLIALIGVMLDGTNDHPLSNIFPIQKIPRCQELVVENLSDPGLSVESLARELQCSPDYLSRRFHHETGKTIVQVINEKRIHYAMELLRKTQLNVSEIAYASGYTTASYFIKVFRKYNGETPGDFRKKTVDGICLTVLSEKDTPNHSAT